MTAPGDAMLRRVGNEHVGRDETFYELTLFISGASQLAVRAICNAQQLCDIHLNGRYHLAVVDVHEDPAAVITSQIIATPTLVKNWPLPVRKVVGDLSHTDKVLLALQLPVATEVSRAFT